ncbi:MULTISPECIES: hypothetical protein [Leptolyngbya]|uniref:hypothetical protein n=1 Tax=Leptolyngbya TaxID=47251 RepID=UPI00168A034A|nr:hypothetical protein [Leptolyngbya sp. FACHB-1624]MBD1856663.1 hypothetical protein [Leptolyngbya sp. FACHB-1624]
MKIQGNEKVKIQKTINDIVTEQFDARTIDHLFMGLRAFSGNYTIFREIADYIAHNDLRNQGITYCSLEAFYLSQKYLMEYTLSSLGLDITIPFPSYIKKLMKYQVDKCDEQQLRNRFNATKGGLKSKIDNLFKDDNKRKMACLRDSKISRSNLEILQYLLSFIASFPAYTQEQILSELLSVMKDNSLVFEEDKLTKQGDKIILCVLTLIHNTKYDLESGRSGECRLSCDKTSLLHSEAKYVDSEGNEVKIDQSFGNLKIHGYVPVNCDKGNFIASFPVITTNLAVEEWCENSLFFIEHQSISNHSFLSKTVRFDRTISINDNFKLVEIAS